jgi:hypothetical protein
VQSRGHYLATAAVPAGNCSALTRGGRLVVLLHVLRWRRLSTVRILRGRATVPLVGAWEAVGLLLLLLRVLGVLLGSHVGSRLLRGRRVRAAHLEDGRSALATSLRSRQRVAGQTYM